MSRAYKERRGAAIRRLAPLMLAAILIAAGGLPGAEPVIRVEALNENLDAYLNERVTVQSDIERFLQRQGLYA